MAAPFGALSPALQGEKDHELVIRSLGVDLIFLKRFYAYGKMFLVLFFHNKNIATSLFLPTASNNNVILQKPAYASTSPKITMAIRTP